MKKRKFTVSVLRPVTKLDGNLIEIASHVSVVTISFNSEKKANKLVKKMELTELSSDYKIAISEEIEENHFDDSILN